MSPKYLSPELERVLAHDVLSVAECLQLPAHRAVDLDNLYPDMLRITDDEGKTKNIDRISAKDDPINLVTIPATTASLQALHKDPFEQRKKLVHALTVECGLTPKDEFELMVLRPNLKLAKKMDHPPRLLLSMESSTFHDLAMDMLRKLATPCSGAALLGIEDEKEYISRFKQPLSAEVGLVHLIAANIFLESEEIAELIDLAAQKGNFEFIQCLKSITTGVSGGFCAAEKARRSSTPKREGPQA